jgi:putative ABC transport system permease protein
MTRHLIHLMWNRKRQNLLLAIEILCSFLVLFCVVFFALHFAINAREPLGFQIERVWAIDVGRPRSLTNADDGDAAAVAAQAATRAAERETIRRLLQALHELPEIEIAAGGFTLPYANSTWGTGLDLTDGRHFEFNFNSVTDDFLRALSMPMRAGRGFSRQDDGAATDPVLINARLAHEMFGDTNPVGQVIKE